MRRELSAGIPEPPIPEPPLPLVPGLPVPGDPHRGSVLPEDPGAIPEPGEFGSPVPGVAGAL